jgi:hypothetical protein
MGLKADGTFSFSGGAADSGFGRLDFEGDSCETVKITYCESGGDPSTQLSYFVNNQSASEKDYQSAVSKQNEKESVTWFDFTVENIEAKLSDSDQTPPASSSSPTTSASPAPSPSASASLSPSVTPSQSPSASAAPSSRELTAAEIKNLNEAFNYPYDRWQIAHFLTCAYSKPSEIDPNQVFYNGAGMFYPTHDDVKDYLAANGYNMPANWREYTYPDGTVYDFGAQLLYSKGIDEVLLRRLGITLNEVTKKFDSMEYVSEWDAYFVRRTDTNLIETQFKSGTYSNDGTYTADYFTKGNGVLTEGTYRLTYKITDDDIVKGDIGYIRFISNLQIG